MSIQLSKFNKQVFTRIFFPPILLIFASSSHSKVFFLAFSPLSYFFAPCNSRIVRRATMLRKRGRAKLNWLENCFQIQIFKFHLYLLAVVSLGERGGKGWKKLLREFLSGVPFNLNIIQKSKVNVGNFAVHINHLCLPLNVIKINFFYLRNIWLRWSCKSALKCGDINARRTLAIAFCVAQKRPCPVAQWFLPCNTATRHEPSAIK